MEFNLYRSANNRFEKISVSKVKNDRRGMNV